MKTQDILTEIGAEGMLALTLVAEAPYTFGDLAAIFSPEVKHNVFVAAGIATIILRIIRRVQTVNSIAAAAIAPAPPPTLPPVQPATVQETKPL